MRTALPSLLAPALLALALTPGCASAVDPGSDASSDAADAAPTDAAVLVNGCAHWVLTDHETRYAGELHTDLHREFSPEGELLRVREHIRTGGHGSERSFREHAYRWSARALTITRVDEPGDRSEFELDEAQRIVRSTWVFAGRTEQRSYTRDAAGRVLERTEQRGEGARPLRCAYEYDAAGQLVVEACDDGTRIEWRYEGTRLVEQRRTSSYPYVGRAEYRWDASGRLASLWSDDGYGPDRAYEQFFAYDAANRVEREEFASAHSPSRRLSARYFYDAQGRFERAERNFDDAGAPGTTERWTRDERGRPASLQIDANEPLRFAYDEQPGRVVVTQHADRSRTTATYRCFDRAVRMAPELPVLGPRVEAPRPSVEHFPVPTPER